MILGDGTLSRCSATSNSRLSIGHSWKQKDYCVHKLDLISQLLDTEFHSKDYVVLNKKNGNSYKTHQGSTLHHRYLTKLRKTLYIDNIKSVNEKILNYLTPEGIAYWYMDDGGIISTNTRKQIYGCFLSTQNFNKEEQYIISAYLKEKYDIDSNVVSHGKGKYRIKINKTNSVKFFKLIEDHVLEQFKYKLCLNYQDYINYPKY